MRYAMADDSKTPSVLELFNSLIDADHSSSA